MRREMARGAAWMLLFRLFDRAVGVVSTSALARLLIPADFGLVAMAMSVIAFIELATAFSFEVALIQKPDPQRAHFDTAWTLNILMAAGGGAVTSALALPAAAFYGDPRLTAVMLAIAAAWVVSGFENTGTVDFRRRMDFAAEFRFMAGKRVIAFAVTMAAALTLRSYWALVLGMATGRLAGVALSYALQPFRPRFSLACARELFSFSGWLLVNNLAGVLLNRLPHFVVGRVAGAQALGAYTVGGEIAKLAHTELVAPINRAMLPGYSRLAQDPPAFRRVCMDATSAILLVVLPVSAGIAVLAGPVVRVLLGASWGEAVPVIRILAVAGAVSALTSNNVAAYLALGRPRLTTAILAARLVLFVALAALLAGGERIVGVAWAELGASLASLLVSLPILFGALQMRAREYLAALWRPLLATASMAGAMQLVLPAWPPAPTFGDALAALGMGIPLGALAYLLSLGALWWIARRPQSVEKAIACKVWAVLAAAVQRRMAKRSPSALWEEGGGKGR